MTETEFEKRYPADAPQGPQDTRTAAETQDGPEKEPTQEAPDFQRPASIDGPGDTFDVPEVGDPVTVPPEIFSVPARDLAQAFIKALRAAPSLKVAGDPKRSTKNQARYLQAFAQLLTVSPHALAPRLVAAVLPRQPWAGALCVTFSTSRLLTDGR